MLSRGVKRKLEDDEEIMAAETSGAFDSSSSLPYPQQRQLVLNMCLSKLQSCHMKVEPSLHRSVLLANTLRQIQEEMRQEGGESTLAAIYDGSSCTYNGGNPPATPAHNPELHSLLLESPVYPNNSSVTDNTMSSSVSAILREAGFVEDVNPAPACLGCSDSEELCFSSSPSYENDGDEQPVDSRSSDSLFGSFEISNSTSYLTDLALDDIFEDIDTSMYDSSDFSTVMSFPVPRSPVSSSEDTMKSFPTCISPSSNGIQICITDLNDLDHIMEILVGS
ncbi:SERTA domain-containing protein 2 [Erpetoichthys calabaricus]|uniref:SERTA domain-containing protein 2 n=1 Tax=Erpetoichthys calabaricus TaxID=27687 RepID=UPI0010A04392|nr:SERTA domain-containing protein 2 [Erpetoichthys calabaricus]XP_028677773.1 SERTA domain-containing protein 2 [Erpetoichthys calabaricus]